MVVVWGGRGGDGDVDGVEWKWERDTEIQRYRQAGRQAGRQTDRQTDRQTEKRDTCSAGAFSSRHTFALTTLHFGKASISFDRSVMYLTRPYII